ncbi:MAG: DUF1318 domain-containing protein [Candidatus Electrothrix sp. MAN1_4]|nr:DUF1318 domain-containing protein [Candidatus Electrothrix sp. MAN1_4]
MKNSITLFLGCLFTLLLCQPIFALELADAKSQGLVGETPSGYLEVVKANPEADKLIKEINAKRKTHYQEIAKKKRCQTEGLGLLSSETLLCPPQQRKKQDGRFSSPLKTAFLLG